MAEHFGDIFKKFLERANQTPGNLAELTGIPRPTLEAWKEGRVKWPRRWQDIAKVACALWLSIPDFDRLLEAANHPLVGNLIELAHTKQDIEALRLLSPWIRGPLSPQNQSPQRLASDEDGNSHPPVNEPADSRFKWLQYFIEANALREQTTTQKLTLDPPSGPKPQLTGCRGRIVLIIFIVLLFICSVSLRFLQHNINRANQAATALASHLTATRVITTAEVATASSVLATETSVAATAMYIELDNDGDGLKNGEETTLGTKLDNPDTDRDGVIDGEEINIWNTSPLDMDSDDDTLSDGEEAATNGCLSPTNPDSDGDGLNDNVDTAGCALPTFTPTPTATPTATPLPGINILPSSASSFEGPYRQWIGQDGVVVDNLRVPVGWQMLVADNYPNTLDPHTGDFFYRPESGPIRNDQLPESEQGLYVFEGDSAMKIFKDDSPIFFTMYRDLELDAGVYLFSIELFADSVVTYRPTKEYATDPLAAEVQLCIEEGAQYQHRDWESVPAGQRVKMELLFVIPSFNVVRIYASFRNRFQYSNNGWYFDNWWLYKVAEYDPSQNLPTEHICDRPQ